MIFLRIYDIIKKKRDGLSLSTEEINYFISNYTKGNIPDYQVSALLMAIFINKMNERETFDLTKAMVDSGDTFDLSSIRGIKVDKHSTGGVGDTTTLILGPMIAAAGVPFVKMSGRGLGHTGGTLDKLESIKGFKVELTNEEFSKIANDVNLAICSQTGNITPADKKLYALRDVTATVDNLSLIAASIMSKKLAIKSDAIILDVKVGLGAFMKSLKDATKLAEEMVRIGSSYGRETVAVVTNMDEPLGRTIGNALEVEEAINTLNGKGPDDLMEVCLTLGSKLLVLAKKASDESNGREILLGTIQSGSALEKFKQMVGLQGGDVSYVEDTSLLPKAKYIIEVKSEKKGFVKSLNAEQIGECALILGAGRDTKETKLDLAVGIVLNKKVDDEVGKGETLAYIHANNLEKGNEIKERLLNIYNIGEKNPELKTLIYREIH
ncbi:MAG: pyrimidine-nucleoside phosphorylase [Tissierellaceae bacterium]|nr:pyrimidine-nucleoside phosphorylase [Tissierellaceae bacterium]